MVGSTVGEWDRVGMYDALGSTVGLNVDFMLGSLLGIVVGNSEVGTFVGEL